MKAWTVLGALTAIGVGIWAMLPASQGAAHLLVTDAVVKPFGNGSSGAFFQIENTGAPDRLISVNSPLARTALYTPESENGLPVPTGTGSLAPDAAHIRLDQDFADGTLIPLTLTFAKAGDLSLTARLSDPQAQGKAEEVGLFGLGDIGIVGEGEPAPAISLTVAPVPDGEDWIVEIVAEDFMFSKDMVGLSHVPGMGHGHLYVGGLKLGRLYGSAARIGALPKGRHEVRVTLNTNDHPHTLWRTSP